MHYTPDYSPVKKYLEEIRILEVKTQMKLSDFLMLPPITKTSGKKLPENLSKISTQMFISFYSLKHCLKIHTTNRRIGFADALLLFLHYTKIFSPSLSHQLRHLSHLFPSTQFHCSTDHSPFPHSFHLHDFQTASFLQLQFQAFTWWLKSSTIS